MKPLAQIAWSSKLSGFAKTPLRLARFVVDVITPPQCLCCEASVTRAASVCVSCWGKFKFLDHPVCDVLGIPFPYDPGEGIVSAAALANPPPWNRARGAVIFDDQAKILVHNLKYRDRHEAGLLMARLMARAGRDILEEAHCVVPVPLHPRRLFQRRFNQAALLAQWITAASARPYAPEILIRAKATRQQVGLDAAQRMRNVKGAFKVPFEQEGRVRGNTIVLVDDVRTTGATVQACAQALKKAGARNISVLTFAIVNEPMRLVHEV